MNELIEQKNVLIAEDDFTSSYGIEMVLKNNFQDKINCFLAKNGKEALEIFEKNKIDILIADINMSPINGIELIEKVIKNYPEVNIIVISNNIKIEHYKQLINLNVSLIYKILGKNDDIINAFITASKGYKYVAPDILEHFKQIYEISEKQNINVTAEELKIIQLLSKGYLIKQIADSTNIKRRTLERKNQQIKQKFEVNNNIELIKKAKDLGII